MLRIEERVKWLQEKVEEANADGLIIAISGGIDSAVVAGLAKKAFPKNTLGLFLDIDSSTTARRNFLRVVEKLQIKNLSIDLTETFNFAVKSIFETNDKYSSLDDFENYVKTGEISVDKTYLDDPKLDLIKGNMKARLRMLSIYAQGQKNNYLVLETSNRSEVEIGYFTKWGDGAGDLAPVSDLFKSEIYQLARELEIPEIVINTSPSADLWEGQTDEDELGFTYNDLELYIKDELNDENKVKLISDLSKRNKHKNIGVMHFDLKETKV